MYLYLYVSVWVGGGRLAALTRFRGSQKKQGRGGVRRSRGDREGGSTADCFPTLTEEGSTSHAFGSGGQKGNGEEGGTERTVLLRQNED